MKKIGIQILLLVATLSCSKRKHVELREAQSIQTEGGGQSTMQAEGAGQSTMQNGFTNLYNAESIRAIGRKLYSVELKDSRKIIKQLREEGADFNKRDKEGNTLMSFVIQEASTNILGYDNRLTMFKGPEDQEAKNILEQRRIFMREVISSLLDAGASVNVKNNWGETPLHGAAKGGLVEVMQVLIAAGANVNAEDNRGETPLHKLARNAGLESHTEAVKALIAAGADVNAKNNEGDTPLQRAGALFVEIHGYVTIEGTILPSYGEKKGHLFKRTIDSLLEVIRILVEYGAAPDVKFYGEFRREPYVIAIDVGMYDNLSRMNSEDAILLVKVAYESIKTLLKTIETQERAKAPYLAWVLGKWRSLDKKMELPPEIKRLIFGKANPLPLMAIEQFLDALNKYVDKNQEYIGGLAFITAMREKGEECEEKIRKIKRRREPVP
ncbi:MAG: ankyrin repeat domain-containing protein [Cytophagales bacterium]|nr:ankyrin repeat domain-containing protein [Cytophagales bacterium]